MDETMLRQMALNAASMRVSPTASVDELLAAADKIVAWMKGGATTEATPAETSTEAPRHESEDAVAGQEPKSE